MSAAPHALLRAVALALVGALAGLVALPLGQHAFDTTLELAILRRLLLWLAAVGHINAQRRHLGFELPPLQIIAMATIDGLKPYPLEIAATRRREQILIVNALGCAGATTRLVDEFSHDALASSAGLGSQACELIR